MLRPKIPTMPTAITTLTPPSVVESLHFPACACQHATAPAPVAARPAIQLTPGSVIALVVGGTAVVLVVGAVLVSMLLAVAITAASLAVCAVVLRSLLRDQRKGR
ncbi:SpdD-like protein [Streptomyces fildesensis]|uniref:SpdD-like protein n=1 Tax=Streptomyces fildesensis TaxID=375757 RepID=A0ABW8CCY2_9ACTN